MPPPAGAGPAAVTTPAAAAAPMILAAYYNASAQHQRQQLPDSTTTSSISNSSTLLWCPWNATNTPLLNTTVPAAITHLFYASLQPSVSSVSSRWVLQPAAGELVWAQDEGVLRQLKLERPGLNVSVSIGGPDADGGW